MTMPVTTERRTPSAGRIVGFGPVLTRGAWQVRKPTDPRDPVDDEQIVWLPEVDAAADGLPVLIGASRIGKSHQHDGKYREDAFAADIVNQWRLAAVADGGGAYELARVGAHVAAEAALEAMRAELAPAGEPGEIHSDAESVRERMRSVLHAGLRAARHRLQAEAERRAASNEHVAGGRTVTIKDLRTTLLVMAQWSADAGRHVVGGGQVGDGIVVARDGAGHLYRLGKSDMGAHGTEVVFLQDVHDEDDEWQRRVVCEVVEGDGTYCLAMTDGVSDDFSPPALYLDRLERALFAAIGGKPPQAAAEALSSLIAYEHRGSFDDRTLVCIYQIGTSLWK